jgi:amino acid adenylation domain-containing protein
MNSDFNTSQNKPIRKKGLPEEIAIAAGQSAKEREYWLKKFSGELLKSHFPYDYSPIEAHGYEFHQVESRLTDEIFHRLMVLRNDSDYTLHMILISAVVVLLHKCTGSTDIIVGTPVDKQEEDTEGELINSALALRNHITGHMTWKELLIQVRQTILEAVENQNYPFETLLYDLNISTADRDRTTGSESWLFDAALVLENIQDKSYLNDIHKSILFCFKRTETAVELVLEYNALLYQMRTARRLINYLHRFMQGALFNVDVPLVDIDILPAEERQRLLIEFNDTFVEYPAEQTLDGLFAEQVEKTPHHIAVVGPLPIKYRTNRTDMTYITYGELNEKSTQLAHLLREKGVQPDTIVGLMVTPSLEMAIGILGILKSGGAYLPIDPDYPEERINYMLGESKVKILVKNSNFFRIKEIEEIFTGDFSSKILPRASAVHPHLSPAPAASLAYVIYTSGSTGMPKGVLVEHGQVVNTLTYRKEAYQMTVEAAALQLFSYVFDGFLTSFFTPIISGARVVLLAVGQTADVAAVGEVIMKNRVTHFISVPALYRAILEGLSGKDLAALQVITLAGDIVSPRLVELTKQKNKNIELAHEYGVTEAAVMSTLYRHQQRDNRITIGHPIGNTSIYIIDNNHHIQPIGIPGELCIGGAGVARGYLNNPELTAEKFKRSVISHSSLVIVDLKRTVIDHLSFVISSYSKTSDRFSKLITNDQCPMTNDRSFKLYRTGDSARWFPDGNIQFLGRIDHQVKIRGVRVELEEIEAQLLSHKKIKEAVVTVREDSTGNQYLCAYWVPSPYRDAASPENEDTAPLLSAADIREYLSGVLPAFLIPSYFVRLAEVPLSANGKADRKGLPEPEITAADQYVAPGDKIQKQLVKIWAEVLGTGESKIGIDDNFFELGGHSLLVTLLAQKIAQCFSVNIPFTEIFRKPIIRQLSLYIKEAEKEQFKSIPSMEEREYYPLSAAQKRIFLEIQLKSDDIRYNTPHMFLIEGRLDKNRTREVVDALIRRHESLRTSFHLLKDIPVQRVHQEVDFRIHYMEAEEDQMEKTVKGLIRPFDLAKAPLLRINLLKLPQNRETRERHILMYDMHHIIGDGVSMDIMAQDLMDLYEGIEPVKLNIQYKDFTLWQNHLLQSDSLKKQGEYWLEVFAGEIPVLDLPTDYPRPGIRSFEGDTLYFDFKGHLTQEVRKIAVEMGCTLFTVLLTIFNILLSRYSMQEDIIVGTLAAGRQHMELEHLIGMFVNTLAIRSFPTKEKTFNQFLEEVKTNSLKAFENQDYQFEQMVSRLRVKRDLRRHVLFDVMFAEFVIDKKNRIRTIKDLVFKPYAIKHETNPFDLVLYASDTGDTIAFKLVYSTHLFKKETIEQMKQHLIKIAETVVANPLVKLPGISLVSSKDKKKFLGQSSKEKLKNVDIDFDF